MLHPIFVNNYFITDLQSDKSKKTYFNKIKGQQNGKLSIIITRIYLEPHFISTKNTFHVTLKGLSRLIE